MPAPLLGLVLPSIIGAAASGIGAITGSRNAKKQRESDEKLTREKLAQDKELAANELALDESKLDPFRAIIAQIKAAELMDRIASYEPLDFSASPYASYIPKGNSGPSTQMRATAAAGRAAALSGQGQATPVANRAAPGASNGVMDLIMAASRGGRPPVANTMPVAGGVPPAAGAPQPAGFMPDIENLDPLQPSYLTPSAGPAPASAARRRRPMRSGRRMAVAA